MIPSIEQIIDGLLAGAYTKAQAESWIAAHMELATDKAYDDGYESGLESGAYDENA